MDTSRLAGRIEHLHQRRKNQNLDDDDDDPTLDERLPLKSSSSEMVILGQFRRLFNEFGTLGVSWKGGLENNHRHSFEFWTMSQSVLTI